MSATMTKLVEVFAIIGIGALGSMIIVVVGVLVTSRGMDR